MNTTEQTIELLEALVKDIKSVSDKPLTIELLRKWRKQLVDVEREERFEDDKEDIERILFVVNTTILNKREPWVTVNKKQTVNLLIEMLEDVISKREDEL